MNMPPPRISPLAIPPVSSSRPSRGPLQTLLRGWHHLSCALPEEPDRTQPLARREAFRRGRLCSYMILFCIAFNILGIPAALFGTNPLLLVVLLFSAPLEVIAIVLNRTGQTWIAGGIVILIFEVGIAYNLATTPGGISPTILPIFDLYVIPLLFAVFVLPRLLVVALTMGNYILVGVGVLGVGVIRFPETTELMNQVSQYGPAILTVPFFLFFIICGAGLLWDSSATRALARADMAEELIRLEQDLNAHNRTASQDKVRLELEIDRLCEALTAVANGHTPSAPVGEESMLWKLMGPLNNQLKRIENLRRIEAQAQQMHMLGLELARRVRRAKGGDNVVMLPVVSTGSSLDLLCQEMNQQTLTFQREERWQSSPWPGRESEGRGSSLY
ncbi:MAG: hypothetical protein J2P36_15255 [Ktedonobacteraceae bacterium]|nr:hypothetical protein [Ktedonobacteraceae bacterium]